MIDRCGKHFATILNFLRDESVPLPENQRELQVNFGLVPLSRFKDNNNNNRN